VAGKRETAQTNLDAVTATGAGSWIVCGGAEDVLAVLDASGVTSGATVKLEGDTEEDGSGVTWTIATVTVTATGATSVAVEGGDVPAAIRWNVTARTDGTYTGTISRRMA
jgi:hypothetical protein